MGWSRHGTYLLKLLKHPTLRRPVPSIAPPKNLPHLRSPFNPQFRHHESRASAFNSRIDSQSLKFSTAEDETGCIVIMSGVGLEVFLEGLIPEIAYSGEKGESHIPIPLNTKHLYRDLLVMVIAMAWPIIPLHSIT
jgi:hypothetical protein